MKKILSLIALILVCSCSTSSDDNGNSNTTVVPVTPTNLIGTVASPTQINLSWTDNSTNEIGFKIDRKVGSGNWVTDYGTINNADVINFTDTSVSAGITYSYRVSSFNSVGKSLTYSNEVSVTVTNTSSTSVSDIDGNTYQSVTICSQTWTKTNLNVSKYSDGTPIPQVTDPTQWANLTTGAWCYYNNDPVNEAVYGKLYNWYAVAGIYDAASQANPALRKKLAPTGWHIPSDVEWSALINCLDPIAVGNINVAGGKMKSTGTIQAGTGLWESPNTEATNASGFTGLPGGSRHSDGTFILSDGTFVAYVIGFGGYWWGSTEINTSTGCKIGLYYSRIFTGLNDFYLNKSYGASARCLKD